MVINKESETLEFGLKEGNIAIRQMSDHCCENPVFNPKEDLAASSTKSLLYFLPSSSSHLPFEQQ